jgi:hypothetical protein
VNKLETKIALRLAVDDFRRYDDMQHRFLVRTQVKPHRWFGICFHEEENLGSTIGVEVSLLPSMIG